VDALLELQAFIDERWAVAQPKFFPRVGEGPRVPSEVTASEAEYFLASVATGGLQSPLFEVDDDRKLRSDRYLPNAGGAPRGGLFFEEFGRLRLETIVHMAAIARLRDEFGWPRSHLIVESPDVVDEDGRNVLRREALDILLLEKPCAELPSKMPIAAARSRVGVEAKADKRRLDKLVEQMRACEAAVHAEHNKCRALQIFRPQLFLGVAAAETWRLFRVAERDGRAVLGDELPDLDRLYFKP
jgi:hypothetical protein